MALIPTGAWSLATTPQPLDSNRPVDPYLVWAELSGWAGFGQMDHLRVLIELAPTDLRGTGDLITAIRTMVASNPLNPIQPNGQPSSPFATASVSLAELATLTAAVEAGLVARFQLGLARLWSPDLNGGGRLERYVVDDERWPRVESFTGFETIGVIDDGCCLAHEALRTSQGGSFLFVWDQSRRDPPNPLPPQDPWMFTQPPKDPWVRLRGVGYGVELPMTRIDDLLDHYQPLAEPAEREFYEKVLMRENWGRDDRSHGAGVLHVIAASRMADASPSRFPLIFVQLPGDTVADASGGSLGVYLLDGARYIVQRTKEVAQIFGELMRGSIDYRTTVNVSLGSIAGPHDGSSITECALAELGNDARVRIVLAAGNTAGKRIHAVRRVAIGMSGRFDFLLPADNPRESYVEVWLPADAALPDDFSVEVTAPDGSRSGPVNVGQVAMLGSAGNALACLVFARAVAQGTRGTMVLLAVRATGQADAESAPYGCWSIDVSTTLGRPVPVHAWVERNDLIVGRRRPQQTRFVDDGSGCIDDDCTLSSVANGANVTVVGAYRRRERAESDYCAHGPVLHQTCLDRPEYYAPGDESASLRGLALPGFFSGTWRRVSGTSVAAPFVTRWIAMGRPTIQECTVTTREGRVVAGIRPEDDDQGY